MKIHLCLASILVTLAGLVCGGRAVFSILHGRCGKRHRFSMCGAVFGTRVVTFAAFATTAVIATAIAAIAFAS